MTEPHEPWPPSRPDDDPFAETELEPVRGDRTAIARGLGWSSLGYPLNMGLLFGSQVIAANLLTQEAFGSYSLAVSIFTVAALIAQLGLPHSLLRRASAAISAGDVVEARHEIASAFLVGLLAALVCVVLFASPAGSEGLDLAFPETAVASVAALVGIKAGLRVMESIVPEALRAFRDFFRVMVYDGLLTNVVFVVVLGIIGLTSDNVSLRGVLVASAVVSALTLVPACASVWGKLRQTRGAGMVLRNPVEPAMWMSTIGRVAIAQLDLLVVGALGNSRDVALYAVPFRLSLLVGLPLLTVNQVVTPLIAGWYARGMLRRLDRTLRATAGYAVAGAVALTLGFLVGGHLIIRVLFGADYEDAWSVLMILCAGQVLQTWAGSCGFALMMTGHQRIYAVVLAASTALTLAADVALFEVLGVEGVALGTAAMLAAQNFVQAWLVQRLAGFTTMADLRASVGEALLWLRHR